jgi:hypothetical protein
VRDGEDLRNCGLELEELEETWLDPKANEEPGPDRYPGVSVINLSMLDHTLIPMQIEVGPISRTLDGVDDGEAVPKNALSKPSQLRATDSLTVGIGSPRPIVYHDLRESNGKHKEIEGYTGEYFNALNFKYTN